MIYLDSLDTHYYINHDQEVKKPNKKYSKNDDRIGKISLILIIAFAVYIISHVFSYAYGQSDFILEANVVSNAMNENPLKITKLEFQGQALKDICPSGQCKIDYTEPNTFFSEPTPDHMSIAYNVGFNLKDDVTNADVGPKKKEFLEKFSASMFGCTVKDIIEDKGQEIYRSVKEIRLP